MKKVGIITFHAAYNYGSMLQAYALQQVIMTVKSLISGVLPKSGNISPSLW